MADNIVDLDILRPEPRYIKLGGNKVDVSFVPAGITFDLEQIAREMGKLNQEQLQAGEGEEARRGFELAIELCSLFCRRTYPEMDKQWFLENTDAAQLSVFSDAIQGALIRSYEGIEEYQPNPTTAKGKTATAK